MAVDVAGLEVAGIDGVAPAGIEASVGFMAFAASSLTSCVISAVLCYWMVGDADTHDLWFEAGEPISTIVAAFAIGAS